MSRNAPVLVIDPGHGGKDPGAVNPGLDLRESDANLTLARKVRDLLGGVPEWEVVMTRDDDEFVSLEGRTSKANRVDLPLVSIHCNAAGPKASGTEVWCYAMKDRAGKTSAGARLADEIQKQLVRLGLKDRKVKAIYSRTLSRYVYRRLWILRKTKRPAVIIECLFITNPDDARFLKDDPPGSLDRVAMAIARGIFRHFNTAQAVNS